MNKDLTHSRWAAPQHYRNRSSNQRNLNGSIPDPPPQQPPPRHLQPPLPSLNQPPSPKPLPSSLSPHRSPSHPSSPSKPKLHPLPKSTLPSYNHTPNTPTTTLQTLHKSLRRLKWKSSFLLLSHTRALTHDTANPIGPKTFPITSDTGRANAAEVMFKADFFEWYALLERCLVVLLRVFGTVVTGKEGVGGGGKGVSMGREVMGREVVPPPPADVNGLQDSRFAMGNTLIGDGRHFHGSAHRFHANVLSALDDVTHPLHGSLGVGEVRGYLGIAKEFRNRWKEVERESIGENDDDDDFSNLHRRYHEILVDLKLDEMLAGILEGLERARGVAGQWVAEVGMCDVDMNIDGNEGGEGDETGVGDAMDWD